MLIKSEQDIKNILANGQRIGKILSKLEKMCRPGVSTLEIDAEAERLIVKAGGRPAFKGYKTSVAASPFPATICASLNEEVVHGIPRADKILKDGDIFSIDVGMQWPAGKNQEIKKTKNQIERGVFTDTAVTMIVGNVPDETKKLLAVTRQALEEGIKAAEPGASVAAIGRAVETYVKSQGNYGIVRDLVGHGVGHNVHEDPMIPNYYDKNLESDILKPGMVIAIEPMISLGGWQVETLADGWTIRMKDRSLCAHFEHTVVITEKGNVVATRRPHELDTN